MKHLIRPLPLITAFMLMLCGCGASEGEGGTVESDKEFLSAKETAKDMGLGWNLGNTMEAYKADGCEKADYTWIPKAGDSVEAYEKCWGAPVTTKEMIDGVKDAGFKTVRVPVFWGNMMENDGEWKINSDYIARVKEIVDYCIEDDLYAVVNIHHFDEFIIRRHSLDECKDIFNKLWTQIGDYFKGYPQNLVFEGYNEYLGGEQFDENGELQKLSDDDAYELTNTLNQTFVDAVRDTGSNNKERVLICSGYWTNIDNTTKDKFKMPDDSAKDKLMVSVHYVDNAIFWQNEVGTEKWEQYTDSQIDLLVKAFSDKDIPVFLGETTSVYPQSNFGSDAKITETSKCLEMVLNKLTDNMMHIPVWWIQLPLLIGFAMLAVQFVVIILERLASLFGCDCAEQK